MARKLKFNLTLILNDYQTNESILMKSKDKEIIEMMSAERAREKGMRTMMDAYQSRLYWHIRRFVGDHEVSQDVLQETFIKAYQNFHQFKQDSQLYTWLYRIATNEALQHIHKQKKMQKAGEEGDLHIQNMRAESSDNDADEIQILLHNAILTLPEKQRLVFNMRYYDDLPYEEMSKILDMSVGTLKTNYHYAKQKIEEYVKENYKD